MDYKESWAPKNWCFWTVVLEKTLESPLGCKKIQPVHPKDQFWAFFGRKLKLQYFGYLMRRADSFEKNLMLGRLRAGGEGDNRGWDGWMASPSQWTWVWVNTRSWWWTGRPGGSWGHKESDTAEWLNWLTDLIEKKKIYLFPFPETPLQKPSFFSPEYSKSATHLSF